MIAIAQGEKKKGTSRRDVSRKPSGQHGVRTVTWVQLVILSVLASIPLDSQGASATPEDRRSSTPTSTKIAADTAATPKGKPAFVFGGVDYFHRWSQNDQHEFTPQGQEDLEKWSDMITMNVYPSTHDGDALAAKANAVLENYKNHGAKLLRTNSVPRTPAGGAFHSRGFWPSKLYRSGICSFQTRGRRRMFDCLFAPYLRRKSWRSNECLAKSKRPED
jgi:hypothetical protein